MYFSLWIRFPFSWQLNLHVSDSLSSQMMFLCIQLHRCQTAIARHLTITQRSNKWKRKGVVGYDLNYSLWINGGEIQFLWNKVKIRGQLGDYDHIAERHARQENNLIKGKDDAGWTQLTIAIGSTKKQELLCLNKISGLQAIKVHSACQPSSTERCLVASGT